MFFVSPLFRHFIDLMWVLRHIEVRWLPMISDWYQSLFFEVFWTSIEVVDFDFLIETCNCCFGFVTTDLMQLTWLCVKTQETHSWTHGPRRSKSSKNNFLFIPLCLDCLRAKEPSSIYKYIPSKTNSFHLKIGCWKMNFLFGAWPIFRGEPLGSGSVDLSNWSHIYLKKNSSL